MEFKRLSKPTITPLNLNHGDTLRFELGPTREWVMTLLETSSEVMTRTTPGGAARDPNHQSGDIGTYAFACRLLINGREVSIRREVGTQASFYEPTMVDGVNIWFDAASCVFQSDGGFMGEKDWKFGYLCQPARKARLVVHEAHLPICPEPVRPWIELPERRLDIRECYNGEDCWMGPYSGGAAHCGLDINQPAGSVLMAPISLDDHYLFHSVAAGYGNNRWCGIRRWPDGSQWCLQSHHQVDMLVPERTPLSAGTAYATGAGVATGKHHHHHFMFRVIEQGGDYWLDPWLIFQQGFKGIS